MGELQQVMNKNDPPFRWTIWLIANDSKSFVNGSKSIRNLTYLELSKTMSWI